MSWSYDPSDLSGNKLNQLRLVIGDTEASDPLLQDQELTFFLEQTNNSVQKAACKALDALIARASGEVNYSLGPYSESATNKINNWKALQQDLLKQIQGCNAPVSKPPTTNAIFRYDVMSVECCEGADE